MNRSPININSDNDPDIFTTPFSSNERILVFENTTDAQVYLLSCTSLIFSKLGIWKPEKPRLSDIDQDGFFTIIIGDEADPKTYWFDLENFNSSQASEINSWILY